MNKCILIGRLTADPELKQTQTGKATCRFKIAVNRPKTKDGQQQADFISCMAWEKTAEMVCKYFSKGKPIVVEGSLRNNDYTDSNGVKHYSMEVLVSNISFCLTDNSQSQQTQQQYQQPPQQYRQPTPPPNYSPSPQQQYIQQPAQQVYQNPTPVQPQQPIGNLEDFEEILSDGTVPF